MEPMTPEERFMKIENLLNAMTEHAAEHEEFFRKHNEAIAKHDERLARLKENAEKNAAAIRDLIVVSRTVLDATRETQGSINELLVAQKAIEQKLHALIDTVDRMVPHLGK